MDIERIPAGEWVTDAVDITVCIYAKQRILPLDFISQELSDFFSERGLSFEFLVMTHDAKPEEGDSSLYFTKQFADLQKRMRIFRLHAGFEKASALKAVEKFIRGKMIVTLETGKKISRDHIETLLGKMAEGFDLVNGVRSWDGEPVLNKWQSSLFNWMTRKLTGTRLNDLNSNVKIFRREVLEKVPLYGDFYRFLPVLAERKGFRVADARVSYQEGQTRSSIHGPLDYVRRFLDILNVLFLTRFTERPLRFFGGLGVSFAAAGFFINAWLVYERFFFHEAMRNRPLMLLGILLIVVGVQIISIGLIGEMILYAKTKDFKDYQIEEILP